MTQLQREVILTAAYDKRHPDPKKNYGIGSVKLIMAAKGPAGAVTFSVLTDWFLPEVRQWLIDERNHQFAPNPAGLDYHSRYPTYAGQCPRASCCWLDDAPCYCDGSVTASDRVFERLLREGSDAVWQELEAFYAERLAPLEGNQGELAADLGPVVDGMGEK